MTNDVEHFHVLSDLRASDFVKCLSKSVLVTLASSGNVQCIQGFRSLAQNCANSLRSLNFLSLRLVSASQN